MDTVRRIILKYASVASLAAIAEATELFKTRIVYAADWNKTVFENRNLTEVLSIVSNGVDKIIASSDIYLRAPDIVDNYAVTPVAVTSNISGTTRIVLICADIDFPLIADFKLLDGTQGFISTRVRLGDIESKHCGKSVTILAVVHANGLVYSASKTVNLRITSHCDGGGI